MRTTALIISMAIIVTAFAGHWILSIILYILMGIAWTKHDSSCPVLLGRLGYSTVRGTVFLFLIWPLVVISDCYESFQTIRRGERYITEGENGDLRKFSDWNAAVECARNKAKGSNKRAMISDQAIFVKQLGMIQHKSWMVSPDGKVEKLSRSGL